MVPFPALFLFFSVSLRCPFCSPNQVFIPDVPPSQIKIRHSSAMTSASVLFRYPGTLLPRASHRDPQPTGAGLHVDKAWCQHLFIFHHSTAVVSVQAPHPSSFSIFLGRFSTNRKQLPCWDSSLPLSREIIISVPFIQAHRNNSKQTKHGHIYCISLQRLKWRQAFLPGL